MATSLVGNKGTLAAGQYISAMLVIEQPSCHSPAFTLRGVWHGVCI
jgi:hypothetical protein